MKTSSTERKKEKPSPAPESTLLTFLTHNLFSTQHNLNYHNSLLTTQLTFYFLLSPFQSHSPNPICSLCQLVPPLVPTATHTLLLSSRPTGRQVFRASEPTCPHCYPCIQLFSSCTHRASTVDHVSIANPICCHHSYPTIPISAFPEPEPAAVPTTQLFLYQPNPNCSSTTHPFSS